MKSCSNDERFSMPEARGATLLPVTINDVSPLFRETEFRNFVK